MNIASNYPYFHLPNLTLIIVIAVTEAFGELGPPRPIVKFWVHSINHDQENLRQFDTFYTNLRCYTNKFFEYYRMFITSFAKPLKKLHPHITKVNTQFHNSISANNN